MYSPNLPGNAFYLACHAILLVPQVIFGIRYKTWGFLFAVFSGHVLEIIGYASRVQMHETGKGFLTNVITITIGPAFFSAAIYLCLARIIAVYGYEISRFQPRMYTIVFMLFDLLALLLQASGGSLLGSSDAAKIDIGLAVMQTGLAVHLASIVVFIALATDYTYRVVQGRGEWNGDFRGLQDSRVFNQFLTGLGIATFCILVRTSFRVAELSNGLHSSIADNEVAFMVLEGAMVLLAAACLGICHPGIAFQGQWDKANFSVIRSKKEVFEEV